MTVKELQKESEKYLDKEIKISGWIRNHRPQKEFGFIDFSDGTSFKHLQVVYTNELEGFNELVKLHNGSSIEVTGDFVKSEGNGQDYELKAKNIKLLGDCSEDYPLQPKKHSMEFLRSIAYLRPRANTFQAVFRVRSVAAYAIHKYFQDRNYIYVHTPLLTTADCEGSDQMFKVTTFDFDNLPKKDGKVDFSKDLFNKKTFITGSGQLHGETFALAFSKIYTFGPTFRTENSNTKTHANEFWMIEPEIAFADINDLMDIEEDCLKYIVKTVMEKSGTAIIGIGCAAGENRAIEAAKQAVSNSLLEETIDGARNAIVNVTGGNNLTLFEIEDAVETVREAANNDVNIIFGAIKNENLQDEVIVTVIATGFDEEISNETLFDGQLPKRKTPEILDNDYEIPPFLRSQD